LNKFTGTPDGSNRSKASLLIKAKAGNQLGERWRVSAGLLNGLDRRNHDIAYA